MSTADKIYSGVVPAPPPGSNGITYYRPKDHSPPPSRRRNRCCCCCVCLLITFAVLLVVLGIAALVIWIVVRPETPKYDVNNVHISNLYVPNSPTVHPVTVFDVVVRNPNKHIGIYYNEIDANIQVYGVSIGSGSLPTFYQGFKNSTFIFGTFTSPGVTFDPTARNALSKGVQVPMTVDVHAKVRLKLGALKSYTMTLKVHCNVNVDLKILTGTQVTSRSCKLK